MCTFKALIWLNWLKVFPSIFRSEYFLDDGTLKNNWDCSIFRNRFGMCICSSSLSRSRPVASASGAKNFCFSLYREESSKTKNWNKKIGYFQENEGIKYFYYFDGDEEKETTTMELDTHQNTSVSWLWLPPSELEEQGKARIQRNEKNDRMKKREKFKKLLKTWWYFVETRTRTLFQLKNGEH